MQLEAALELALPERVADATIVPLLNGTRQAATREAREAVR